VSERLPLAEQSCVPCEAGCEPLEDVQVRDLHQQVPDWDIRTEDDVQRLVRRFAFPDFAEALTFTNRVGEMAESENHHPQIVTEWGAATVTWWTHRVGGLHQNDFVAAAKTDRIFVASGGS
jgi:4a-hydroxytetrahydrobiopterin dehydratase